MYKTLFRISNKLFELTANLEWDMTVARLGLDGKHFFINPTYIRGARLFSECEGTVRNTEV